MNLERVCHYSQLWADCTILKTFLQPRNSLLPQPGMVAQRCCPRSLGVKVGRLEVKASLASAGRSYLKNIVRTVFHLTRHLSWSGIHMSVFHPFKAQGIPTLCQETHCVVCERLEVAFPLVSGDSANVLRRNYQAHICWIKYNGGNTIPFSALAFCDVPKNYSLRILVKSIYSITQSPSRLWHLCIVAFKDSMGFLDTFENLHHVSSYLIIPHGIPLSVAENFLPLHAVQKSMFRIMALLGSELGWLITIAEEINQVYDILLLTLI